MSEAPTDPVPRYRVSYSERVRIELRKLAGVAYQRGLVSDMRDALKKMDEMLQVYPQFGEPLRDLTIEPMRQWIGTVPPLVVQYVLDEERRLVMVGGTDKGAAEIWARLNDRSGFCRNRIRQNADFRSELDPRTWCRTATLCTSSQGHGSKSGNISVQFGAAFAFCCNSLPQHV
jgi:hypothetical protein